MSRTESMFSCELCILTDRGCNLTACEVVMQKRGFIWNNDDRGKPRTQSTVLVTRMCAERRSRGQRSLTYAGAAARSPEHLLLWAPVGRFWPPAGGEEKAGAPTWGGSAAEQSGVGRCEAPGG